MEVDAVAAMEVVVAVIDETNPLGGPVTPGHRDQSSTSHGLPATTTVQAEGAPEEIAGNGNAVAKQARDNADRTQEEQDICDMLICPICLDLPRRRPIYTCNNGHIMCYSCKEEWSKYCKECMKLCARCVTAPSALCKGTCKQCPGACPTCRDHSLKPDLFVGKLADAVLADIVVDCKFTAHGCSERQKVKDILGHEEKCQFREAHCPAKHRGSCQWVGSLAKMIVHVKKAACIQILRSNEADAPFRSYIGDFSDPKMTVFNRTQMTHWKPILLISKAVYQLLIYLTVMRTSLGQWQFFIRSFSPPSVLKAITVKLEVFKAGDDDAGQRFTYQGPVISNNLTNHEAAASGKLLQLTDAQLRLLKTDQTIFDYQVSVLTPRIRKREATQTLGAVEAPASDTKREKGP